MCCKSTHFFCYKDNLPKKITIFAVISRGVVMWLLRRKGTGTAKNDITNKYHITSDESKTLI